MIWIFHFDWITIIPQYNMLMHCLQLSQHISLFTSGWVKVFFFYFKQSQQFWNQCPNKVMPRDFMCLQSSNPIRCFIQGGYYCELVGARMLIFPYSLLLQILFWKSLYFSYSFLVYFLLYTAEALLYCVTNGVAHW